MDNNQLTIADLASIHSIIEAATQRGAFRANELSQVGAVYDKLSAFLQVAQAQMTSVDQPPAQAQPQGEQHA